MVELKWVWEGWQKPIGKLQKIIEDPRKKQLSGSARRSVGRLHARLGHLQTSLEYISEYYPALAQGNPGVLMSDTEVTELIHGACLSGAGEKIKDSQRYLYQGLKKGVEDLGWRLSPPAPIASVQIRPSMFSPSMTTLLTDYDALDDQFMATLSRGSDDQCIELDAGELLFSMVFHSAGLSKRLFLQVSAAIRAGVAIKDELSWLELDRSLDDTSVEKSKERRRRIFLAPVTQLLLRRWYLRWGKAWPDVEGEGPRSGDEQLMKTYVDHLARDIGMPSHRYKKVFDMAESNLTSRAPGFIVHYARTPDLGVSLPLANWMRLITGQVSVTAQRADLNRKPDLQLFSAPQTRSADYPLCDQRPPFKNLKHALTKFERQLEIMEKKRSHPGPGEGTQLTNARSNASKAIRGIASRPKTSVILQLICHYALFLTRQEGLSFVHWRERIRNVAYLSPLLDYDTEVQSEFSLETDEWQAIYEAVITGHPGDDAALQKTLSDWHEFLHQFYGVERVALDGGSGYGVDAHIVTPREFLAAKQHLMNQVGNEFASVQLALLILGYRCGLRRTEAWARRFADFHGLDDPSVESPELVVRPTKIAGVKSDSALRKLPLRLLLTQDELAWLADFVRDRKQRGASNDCNIPVFADPVSGTFRITERMGFEGLTTLMKAVTGDENFRFHHLRHSFASITILRVLERTPFELLHADWFPSVDEALGPNNGQALFWKQAGLGDACRGLALLSQWMGHSSERVTLRSYTHLLDYLLGWFVRNRINPSLSIDQQVSLLDKRPASLERFRHRHGLADGQTPAKRLVEVTRTPKEFQLELPSMRNAPEQLPVPSVSSKQDINPLLPYRLELQTHIWKSATCNEQTETALQRAAFQLDIEPHIAQQWHCRSVQLMAETTARGNPRFTLPEATENTILLPEHFSLIFRAPNLPTYPAPPQSRRAFVGMLRCFQRLSEWVSVEPDTARWALFICKNSIQRSHAEIRPKGEDNIPFMKLLRAVRLASCVTVKVKTLKENKSRALSFWAAQLDVAKKNISVEVVAADIPPNGNVSLPLAKPGELQSRFWFWSSVRFLIATGCVLYDAVELNDVKILENLKKTIEFTDDER